MPPSFFYFDMGNVLLHFSHEQGARQMAEVASAPYEGVWDVVYGTDGLEWDFERGEIDEAEFYERFCQATDTRPDRAALEEAGNAIFRLNRSILPVVAHLEAAGQPLGVLSNTSPAHWRWCANGRFSILPKSFRHVVLSYEAGSLKPDARMYEFAADRAGVAPSEIFYIDDRPDNVAAAKSHGWDAVVYSDTPALVRELRNRCVKFNF